MSKTIGLKLTDAEIIMVNQLKRDGLTNSDVLRNALHQYFDHKVNQVNHKVNQVNHKVNHTDVNQVNQEVNRVNQYDELNQSIRYLDGKLNNVISKLEGKKSTYNTNLARGLL